MRLKDYRKADEIMVGRIFFRLLAEAYGL